MKITISEIEKSQHYSYPAACSDYEAADVFVEKIFFVKGRTQRNGNNVEILFRDAYIDGCDVPQYVIGSAKKGDVISFTDFGKVEPGSSVLEGDICSVKIVAAAQAKAKEAVL